MVSSLIAADDGTRLHVEHDALGGGRRACVLIHGFGDGAYVWRATRDAIAADAPTVAIDLRGHGDSERSRSGRYDVDTYVSDVAQAIRALELDRPIAIGHSLGGEIAVRLAARDPRSIHAAVIVDQSPVSVERGDAEVIAQFRRSLRPFASIDDHAAWLVETRPLLLPEVAHRLAASALRRCDDGFRIKADPALADALEAMGGGDDWSALLEAIACPALVVRGIASAVVSEASARRTSRLLRRGRLAVIPMAGHAVVTDNEPAFATVVRDFVRDVSGD